MGKDVQLVAAGVDVLLLPVVEGRFAGNLDVVAGLHGLPGGAEPSVKAGDARIVDEREAGVAGRRRLLDDAFKRKRDADASILRQNAPQLGGGAEKAVRLRLPRDRRQDDEDD